MLQILAYMVDEIRDISIFINFQAAEAEYTFKVVAKCLADRRYS